MCKYKNKLILNNNNFNTIDLFGKHFQTLMRLGEEGRKMVDEIDGMQPFIYCKGDSMVLQKIEQYIFLLCFN